MHNIILHISIYLFPWLHVLCDLSLINNERKHALSAIIFYSYPCFFKHYFLVCLNMCSYAQNVSIKMTLCVWAFNILTFTPN